MRLNLGCGVAVADGWVNIDYAVGARLRRIPVVGALVGRLGILNTDWDPGVVVHDLRKPLPWTDASADAIYSSHTLEHLDREDGRRLIAECHRVLKPAGLLRIVVPDLQGYVAEYTTGRLAATDMLEALHVLGARRLGFWKELFSILSGSSHRCMYDAPTLTALLQETGFDARICAPCDSAIPGIDRFEPGPGEWSEDSRARNLFVEGRKRDAEVCG